MTATAVRPTGYTTYIPFELWADPVAAAILDPAVALLPAVAKDAAIYLFSHAQPCGFIPPAQAKIASSKPGWSAAIQRLAQFGYLKPRDGGWHMSSPTRDHLCLTFGSMQRAEDAMDRVWYGTRTAVYRTWDADRTLLYVGISGDPEQRRRAHLAGSSWSQFADTWLVTWHTNRIVAEFVEARAIIQDRPLFNARGSEVGSAPLVAYLIRQQRLDLLKPAVSRG